MASLDVGNADPGMPSHYSKFCKRLGRGQVHVCINVFLRKLIPQASWVGGKSGLDRVDVCFAVDEVE